MNWVAMSFQLKTKGLTFQGFRELPESQLMVMRVSHQGIHIPLDMLSSIPNHAIILKEYMRIIVGKLRLLGHFFKVKRPHINVSKTLYFPSLKQNGYDIFLG